MKQLGLIIAFAVVPAMISAQEMMAAEDIVDALGIDKKGRLALNQKPGKDYVDIRDKLIKKAPDYLYYDEINDLFSLVYDEEGANYSEIKYTVQDNVTAGVHVDTYLSSSAKNHQIMGMIEEILNKNYDQVQDTRWEGKSGGDKVVIEFFDGSSNGFVGFVLDIQIISE